VENWPAVTTARRRIGVMGGTFDPIHYGHLVTAEVARAHFGLDEVLFVPTGEPPHKAGRAVSPAEDRYLMTVLATATNPNFLVSRIEIERPGPSYTVDTLSALKAAFGPDVRLHFITGADAVREILNWRDPKTILALAEVIAATRPGYRLTGLDKLEADLDPGSFGRIRALEVPALAISSSDIRRRVAEGLPIKYLVPEAVEQYIAKMGLYRPGGRDGGRP
jgi:nicotinate-nucleotide adenylyltransferase